MATQKVSQFGEYVRITHSCGHEGTVKLLPGDGAVLLIVLRLSRCEECAAGSGARAAMVVHSEPELPAAEEQPESVSPTVSARAHPVQPCAVQPCSLASSHLVRVENHPDNARPPHGALGRYVCPVHLMATLADPRYTGYWIRARSIVSGEWEETDGR